MILSNFKIIIIYFRSKILLFIQIYLILLNYHLRLLPYLPNHRPQHLPWYQFPPLLQNHQLPPLLWSQKV